MGPHPRWVNRLVVIEVYRDDQHTRSREGPGARGLLRILLGPALAASVRAEVVSDLRRATSVQHHRRTEPSANQRYQRRYAQNQRNLAVTNTANHGWKTFTRPGSLVRPSIGCTESPYIAEFPADHARRASDTRQRMRRARGRS